MNIKDSKASDFTNSYTQIMAFSDIARRNFIDWINEMNSLKTQLPEAVKGFIPKTITYAVRASGAIHCMDCFSKGCEPSSCLEWPDVQKGIQFAVHYLSHAIIAVEALTLNKNFDLRYQDEQALRLAHILESLKQNIDAGRLAIGFIWSKYNETFQKPHQIKSEKSMGALLRHYELTLSNGKHWANGKKGVRCLIWDKTTDKFIDQVLNVLKIRKSSHDGALDSMTCENECPQEISSIEDIEDNDK